VARTGSSVNESDGAESDQRWAQTVKARSTRAHGRRTLVKLLDAAEAEFAAHGWHGARMARLAKRAGTAHGTVYAYFSDKDDLLFALAQDVGADLRASMAAMPVLEPGPEGFAALRDWVAEVCAGFKRHAPVYHALAEALADEDDSRAGRAGLREQRRVMTVIADRVRATGTTGLDPEMAALSIYALLEGANESVHRGELLVSDDELVTGLAEFVHRSVFGSPPPKTRKSAKRPTG
jgi:AcrR family transcriptional regulator